MLIHHRFQMTIIMMRCPSHIKNGEYQQPSLTQQEKSVPPQGDNPHDGASSTTRENGEYQIWFYLLVARLRKIRIRCFVKAVYEPVQVT
jgi:hypothetical protein